MRRCPSVSCCHAEGGELTLNMCHAQGMEDVITCTDGILRPSMKSSCLLTMLDGHCGRKAADEVAQELPRDLGKRLMRHRHSLAAGQGAGSAWTEAFLATDASIKAEEGCTATALLIWVDEEGQACMQASISRTSLELNACLSASSRECDRETAQKNCVQAICASLWLQQHHKRDLSVWATNVDVFVWATCSASGCMQAANVGDSAAVYAQVPAKRKLGPQVQALTEDHRLTNPSERQRLAGIHHVLRLSLPMEPSEHPMKGLGHSASLQNWAANS